MLRSLVFVSFVGLTAVSSRSLTQDPNTQVLNREQKTDESQSTSTLFNLELELKAEELAVWTLFSGFVDRYNRTYGTKSKALYRFRVYEQNIQNAKMWQKNERGTAVYGETRFMDLTPTEFRKIYISSKWQKTKNSSRTLTAKEEEELETIDVPISIDWREKNAVTEVKDQGQCGSCWAFSATGNIEGQWAIKTGKLISLSEQQLLDCDPRDDGCDGGLPKNAYDSFEEFGGLMTEEAYPYAARAHRVCRADKSRQVVYINSSLTLPPDETKMAAYLAKNGPLSIGINSAPLQYYKKGICYPWTLQCLPTSLDHGVLVVGYGEEGTKLFWNIKMSAGAENAEDPAVEIAKVVKRSGAFDKVKKEGVEELEQMSEVQVSRDYMINLVRINFEKQSKERKYPIPISERRAMLKNMISGATMFDSLTNSIQHFKSETFKSACQKVSDEVDKLVPQFFPEVSYNPELQEWELPMPKTEHPTQSTVPVHFYPTPGLYPFCPPPICFMPPLGFVPPPPNFVVEPPTFDNTTTQLPQYMDNNESMDMELDSSSSASSVEYQKELTPPPEVNPLSLPPPPAFPNFTS